MIRCMRPILLAAPLSAALLVAACAGSEPSPCPEGFRPGVLAEAYFGRAVAGRADVSDAEWAVFAADLTRLFPGGFAIADISGQWRGADGLIVHGPARRISVVLTDPDRQRAGLAEAAAAYRTRFAQDRVLLTEAPVCARF